LLDSIHRFLGGRVEVAGDGAGAHIVLWLRRGATEEKTISRAAALGVAVYGISPYFLRRSTRPGILLGYSLMRESEIREGIRRLGEAIERKT
jgi:GntR family transcriptional regulator/MocR family aminotransferase